ncbi:hypothetical protein FQR65_LT04595 [Abscondita terminalis]|nr:hypothetical protein FQR65_LT04595 [Abscondita terminalis]
MYSTDHNNVVCLMFYNVDTLTVVSNDYEDLFREIDIPQYEGNDTRSFILNVYKADPFAYENNCGRRANLISIDNCDDVWSIEFEQVISNYNGCHVMFGVSNEHTLTNTFSKYGKALFAVMEEVRDTLNATISYMHIPEALVDNIASSFDIFAYDVIYGLSTETSHIFFEDDYVWIGTEANLKSPFQTMFAPFTNVVMKVFMYVWLIVLAITYADIEITKSNTLEKCATGIIRLMFYDVNTLIFVSNEYEDLFEEIDIPQVRVNTNYVVQNEFQTHSYNYVFHEKNIHSFLKTLSYIMNTNLWSFSLSPRGKVFIMTENKNISHFFQIVWITRNIKTIVLQYEQNGTNSFIVNVYKADPFAFENNCGRRAHLISAHNCDDVTSIEFEQVIPNYNGCSVMFGLSNDQILTSTTFKYSKVLLGIIQAVRDTLNATVNYKYIPEALMNNISASFDIFAYDIIYGLSTETSHIVFEDDYVWIGTEPKLRSPFKTMFAPFTNGVWMMILLVLVCVTFLWFIIISVLIDSSFSYTNLLLAFSRAASLMFAVSVSTIPNVASLKPLVICYLVYIIHMHTAYTSDIINDLVAPKFDDQILNLETLADTDIPIFVIDSMYFSIINDRLARSDAYYKLVKNFIVSQQIGKTGGLKQNSKRSKRKNKLSAARKKEVAFVQCNETVETLVEESRNQEVGVHQEENILTLIVLRNSNCLLNMQML